MKCPYCGTENADNAIYCKKCDQWIMGSVYIPPEPLETQDHSPKPKSKTWMLIMASVLVLMVCLALAQGWKEPPSPTTTPPLIETSTENTPSTSLPSLVLPEWTARTKSDVYLLHDSGIQYQKTDPISYLVDDQMLYTDLPKDRVKQHFYSMNSHYAVLELYDGSLYFIGKIGESNLASCQLITTEAISYEVSLYGGSVAYQDSSGQLWIYSPELEQHTIITTSNCAQYCISPNGRNIVFVATNPADASAYQMYSWVNGVYCDHGAIDIESSTLLTISNSGECIYYFSNQRLFSRNSNGNTTIVHSVDTDEWFSYFHFNAHHDQVLYISDKGSYLSINGRASTCITNSKIPISYPVFSCSNTRNRMNIVINTLGIYNFSRYPYQIKNPDTGNTYNVMVIIDNEWTPYLSDVSKFTHSINLGVELVHLSNQSLYLIDHSADSITHIGDNVISYIANDNVTVVCYRSGETLYRWEKDGSTTVIAMKEDPRILCGDYICWVNDDTLIIQGPGKAPVVRLTGILDVDRSYYNRMYITTEDGLYLFLSDGTLMQINPQVTLD